MSPSNVDPAPPGRRSRVRSGDPGSPLDDSDAASARAEAAVSAALASGPSQEQRHRTPTTVVETLRLLVIVFCSGAGYEIGRTVAEERGVLGPLNGTAVGMLLGVGFGYVLGGVLGRTTAASAEAAQSQLRAVSADTLVAGGVGLVGGVLFGAGVAWPLLLLPQAYLGFPLFAFVVVVLGFVGAQVGASKRDDVLALFGARAGVGPRRTPSGALDKVVDSSVAIDGRVLEVVRAGFLHGPVLVPSPVLAELQGLADAEDPHRRGRGRRGLEVLEALKREPAVDLRVLDVEVPGVAEVDAKLVRICLDRSAALVTLDANLARAAGLAGVAVMNLHALALAVRPPVLAGEDVLVNLIKPGREQGQAVGYLDDGSMVVVERARPRIGSDVLVHVTSVVTTANGRLVFGRIAAEGQAPRPSAPSRRA